MKTRISSLSVCRLLAIFVFAGAGAAHAALTVSLSPSALNSAGGAAVVFSGTLINTSTTDQIYLNDIQPALSGSAVAAVVFQSNTFFSNVPGILAAGETYTGPIFQVTVSATAALIDYSGTIAIVGGTDIFAAQSLATAGFEMLDQPIDNWRYEYFGAAANDPAADDTADWDGDGIPNILEYALAFDPTVSTVASLPAPAVVSDYLTFSYVPNPNATDVLLSVEASTDLINWNTSDVETVSIEDPDPPNRITVRYKNPVSVTPAAFLRLRVTKQN